ncbi:MAG TPA: FMN-binding protein [Verrucomicrobiae bacterium]|nr:FMN-binding protein [Verrucomicrobiae bacterium]
MPLRAGATLAATVVAVVLLFSFRTPPAAPISLGTRPSSGSTATPSVTPTRTPSGAPPAGGPTPTPAPTSAATPTAASTPTPAGRTRMADGTYTGQPVNIYYGNVQVKVVVAGGKIVTIKPLQFPNDNPQSSYINSQALPLLRQEVLQVQSTRINGVSGATYTSYGYYESLKSALKQIPA